MIKQIAVLGATSHIAKNLILRFDPETTLSLFCRNRGAMEAFLSQNKPIAAYKILGYEDFSSGDYDAIINCVGVADPKKQKADPYESFVATERYDDMVLDFLGSTPSARYINFSSGAIFGTEFNEPVSANSIAAFIPNELGVADAYRIAKLNAEVKHRCLPKFSIVDIRIFSFFSQHIDINAGYMLSEVTRCLMQGKPFRTNLQDIARDYIAPDDLSELVRLALLSNETNCVVDAMSAKPVRKSEILKTLTERHGLEIELFGDDILNVSGRKSEYFSTNHVVEQKFGFLPKWSSLDCIEREIYCLLEAQSKVEKGLDKGRYSK